MTLPVANYDLWLDPGISRFGSGNRDAKPYDAERMRRYALSLTPTISFA